MTVRCGLADERPVAPSDLRGRVDGLAAARSEEHRSVLDGREVGDAARELERRLVRVVAEDVMGGERPQLRPDGVRDLDPAVTDVREPEARGGIEVLVPVDVPDAGALSAREDELVPVDLAHRGEGVPEAGAGGRHRRQPSRVAALNDGTARAVVGWLRRRVGGSRVGGHQIAQLNVARAVAPLDDPRMADFVNLLDEINRLAERSPGFVWRLQGPSGNATDLEVGRRSAGDRQPDRLGIA